MLKTKTTVVEFWIITQPIVLQLLFIYYLINSSGSTTTVNRTHYIYIPQVPTSLFTVPFLITYPSH